MFNAGFKFRVCLLVLVTSSIVFVGCLPKSKKYESAKITMPEVKLPSGGILKNFSSLRIDEAVWADEVKTRAKSCVESLCSIPSTTYFELENEGYILKQTEIDKLSQAKQKFEDEIWPQMLVYINKDKDKSQKWYRDLLGFYEESPADAQFGITEFTSTYIKYLFAISLIDKYEQEDYDNSDREFRLKSSVIDAIPDDQKENVKVALQIMTKTMFSNSYQNAQIIKKRGLRTFLLNKYKKYIDISMAKEIFVLEINQSLEEVAQYLPIFVNQFKGSLSYKKLIQGKDMLPVEEADVASMYHISLLFASFLNDPWEEFNQLNLDIDSLISRSSIIETIKEKIEQEGEEKFKASKDKAYNICKESISSHLISRPTKSQVVRFKQQIDKIKEEAKAQANLLYPNKEQDVQHMIDNVNFSMPFTEKESISQIKNSVKYLISEINNEVDVKDLSDTDAVNFGGVIVAIQKFNVKELDDSFEDLSELCLKYLPKGLADHTYTFENKVVVSANTVKSPHAGAAIVAHELGHRVEAELGKNEREELNQCLVDRHFSWAKKDEEKKHINFDKFFKEDFADNFSTKIMIALGMTENANNLGCLLFGSSNEITNQVKYFGWNTIHPLVNNNKEDSHAASLYRLLQIANDFGNSSQMCRNFHDEEKKNIYFVNKTEIVRTPKIKTCN